MSEKRGRKTSTSAGGICFHPSEHEIYAEATKWRLCEAEGVYE